MLNGWANFTNLAISNASMIPYTLIFECQGLRALSNVTVSVGSAAALKIIEEPESIMPGQVFDFKVLVQDAGGNTVRDTSNTIQVSIPANYGFLRNPTLKSNSADGKLARAVSCSINPCCATGYQLSVDTAPLIYSFLFTLAMGEDLSLTVESSRFAVNIGEVAGLRMISEPVDTASGNVLKPVELNLVDSGNNIVYLSVLEVTVDLVSSSDGQATLSGTMKNRSVFGIVSFTNISLAYSAQITRSRGIHILQFSSGSVSTTSNPFFVHGIASSIILQTVPSIVAFAGEILAQQPIIEIRDIRGIRVFTTIVSVSVGLFGSGGTLLGSASISSTNGLASFTDLSISAIGTYQLVFSAQNVNSIASDKINVIVGHVSNVQISSGLQPGSTILESQLVVSRNFGGEPLVVQPQIALFDSGFSACIGLVGLVTAMIFQYPSNSSDSNLNALYGTSIVPVDPATATAQFTNIALNLKGIYKLSFHFGPYSVTSNEFEISVGSIAQIKFGSLPDSSIFAELFIVQPTLILMDRGGNPVLGTPWVHLGINMGIESGSQLQGCFAQFAILDSGIVSFSGCSIAGTVSKNHTLVASTLLTGGQIVDGVLEPVDLTSGLLNALQNGMKLILESRPFLVTGKVSQMILNQSFSQVVAFNLFQVQPLLLLTDSNNFVVPSSNFSVNVRLKLLLQNSNQLNVFSQALMGNTQVRSQNGIAAFTDLFITSLGSYDLVYSTNTSYVSDLYQPITVLPGLAHRLKIIDCPTVTQAGDLLHLNGKQTTLIAVDVNGNHATDSFNVRLTAICSNETNKTICFNDSSGDFFDNGQITSIEVLNGSSILDNFRLIFASAVRISFMSTTLTNIVPTETTISVHAASAVELFVIGQPAAAAKVNFKLMPFPMIEVRDAFKNIVTSYNRTVSVSFYWAPTSASALTGKVNVASVNGVAVFDQISVSSDGDGYQLLFVSGPMSAISNAFSVFNQETKVLLQNLPKLELAGIPFVLQPLIKVFDDIGRLNLASTAVVHAALSVNISLYGRTTLSITNGVAQFTDLFIDFPGTFYLRFAVTTLDYSLSSLSDGFNVIVGAPTCLLFLQAIDDESFGGIPFPIQPVLYVADAGENLVNISVPVTTSLLNSLALLGGSYRTCTVYRFDGLCLAFSEYLDTGGFYGKPTPTYSSGVLVFTDLSVDRAGVGYMITFSSPGLKSLATNPFTVLVGPVNKLYVFSQPGGAYSGQLFQLQPTIQCQDAGGNFVPTTGLIITASIGKMSISEYIWPDALLGTLTTETKAGYANFTDLSVIFSATYSSIVFNSPSLMSTESNICEVGSNIPMAGCQNAQNSIALCGPADVRVTVLQIISQPANSAVGLFFSAKVCLRDMLGNLLPSSLIVTAAIKPGSGSGTTMLSGGVTVLKHGLGVFSNLAIDSAGVGYVLEFFCGNLTVDSEPFIIEPGIAENIRIVYFPSEISINAAQKNISVAVLDAGGGLAKDSGRCYLVSVSLVENPPGAQIIGSTTAIVSSGTANFSSLLFAVPGKYVLNFSCLPLKSNIPSVSRGVVVRPFGNVGVNPLFLLEGDGLVVPSFPGKSSDTFRPFEFSSQVYLALRDQAGNIMRSFSGNVLASMGTNSNYVLSMAATSSAGLFIFTNLFFYPSQVPDGNPLAPIASSNESIAFNIVQLGFSFQGSFTLQNIQVTEPIFLLHVEQMTPSVQAGEPFSIIVNILSANDLTPMLSFSGTIVIEAVASQPLLGNTQMLSSGPKIIIQGLQFSLPEENVKLNISASQHYASWVYGSTNLFDVAIGVPRSLAIIRQPAGCFGGVACSVQPSVQLLDGSGNILEINSFSLVAVAQPLDLITDNESPSNAMWRGSSDVNGIVSFTDILIAVSGRYSILFFAHNLLSNATSNAFEVYVGSVAQASMIISPTGLITSEPFSPQPVVIASDAGGNWVQQWFDTVVAGIWPNCPQNLVCSLSGTTTQSLENGITIFTNLFVNFAGTFILRFKLSSISSCNLLTCWSPANQVFVVIPGKPYQLSIQDWEVHVLCAGTAYNGTISIAVQDFAGNLVSSAGAQQITVISPYPDSPVLGTITVSSVSGIAYFTNLRLDRSCSWYNENAFSPCYNLTFYSQGMSITSKQFSVWAGLATGIGFIVQPSNSVIGIKAGTPVVQYIDAQNNPVFRVPAGFTEYCGSTYPLMAQNVSIFSAPEQISGKYMLLGTWSTLVQNSGVYFSGLSVNWGIPPCTDSEMCFQQIGNNISKFRLRAIGSFGFYVADSETFSVDVPQPVNVVASASNITHIFLSWNAPFYASGAAPTLYNVLYRKTEGNTSWIKISGITNTSIAVGPLNSDILYQFQVCSQSLIGDSCTVTNPAILLATAVQPVDIIQIQHVDLDYIILSWNPPSIGNIPPSYRVGMIDSLLGYETIVVNNTITTYARISGLSISHTYQFTVYACSSSGTFFSPQGPSTGWISPVAAPTFVGISCGSDPCYGNSTKVFWTPPSVPPKSYRLVAEQYEHGSLVFAFSADLLCKSSFRYCISNQTLMNLTVNGILRGVPLKLFLFSQSLISTQSFSLSASIDLLPISFPPAPRDLRLQYLGTEKLLVRWSESDDNLYGSAQLSMITRFVFQVNDSTVQVSITNSSSSWSALLEGVRFGRGYDFLLFAVINTTYGSVCMSICNPVSMALNGLPFTRQIFLGFPPIWDPLHAPIQSDTPIVYNSFVGNLFSFSEVTALGSYPGQNISIRVSGLFECGAQLSSSQNGNPATVSVFMVPSVMQLGMTFPLCFTAQDQFDVSSDTRCIFIYVARPNPSFVQIQNNQTDAIYTAVVGCAFSLAIVAADTTSGVGITAQQAASNGYKVHIEFYQTIVSTALKISVNFSLPSGAVLLPDSAYFANPTKRELKWTPVHGQEGFYFKLCFALVDSLGTINTANPSSDTEFCPVIKILRCRYCLQPGESLFTVSQSLGSSWLDIWGGNPFIQQPSQTQAFTEVILGPLYIAQSQDSIDSISKKLGFPTDQLLNWNPDLNFYIENTSYLLQINQELCILPNTCAN